MSSRAEVDVQEAEVVLVEGHVEGIPTVALEHRRRLPIPRDAEQETVVEAPLLVAVAPTKQRPRVLGQALTRDKSQHFRAGATESEGLLRDARGVSDPTREERVGRPGATDTLGNGAPRPLGLAAREAPGSPAALPVHGEVVAEVAHLGDVRGGEFAEVEGPRPGGGAVLAELAAEVHVVVPAGQQVFGGVGAEVEVAVADGVPAV